MIGSRHKIVRAIGVLAIVVMVGIQFVRVEQTNPPVVSELDAPEEVRQILRRACYDCHSHETDWPWYSHVAPVSWWVVEHVEHGRDDLNFSDWPTFDFELQQHALRDIEEQIAKDEMPLRSYRILHAEARLSETERATLLGWAREGI